jgi:hypothetical protein
MQGEAGFLSGDPLCAYCQDFYHFKVLSINQKKQTLSQATLIATVENGDKKETVEFSLLKIKGLWTVDDIHTVGAPSLQAGLEQEIRELQRTK